MLVAVEPFDCPSGQGPIVAMLDEVGQKLSHGLADQWCTTESSAKNDASDCVSRQICIEHLALSQYVELVIVLPVLAWYPSYHTTHSAIHACPAFFFDSYS